MRSTLLEDGNRLDFIEVVQRTDGGILAHEDVALDEVREHLLALVRGVFGGGDGEDVVELFQSALLGLCSIPGKLETTANKDVCKNVPGTRKKIMTKAVMLSPA